MKENIVWLINQYKEYNLRVALSTLMNKVYFYGVHTDELAYKINKWKHRCITSYLTKQYKDLIDKYKVITEFDENQQSINDKYIWTIWWQGEENAPEALRMCYQSMRKYSNGHEVVVISKENLHEYITLSEHIVVKMEEGKINFIHFADIIRMNLLREYGGMWLDATIFLTDDVPEEIFDYPYYTGKLKRTKMSCVSEGRWNGTFFAGKRHNPFFEFMVEFYEKYWKEHNQIIDYFLIDYMTDIAYENIPLFRKQLDDVPYNNEKMFEMGAWLNMPFDKVKFEESNINTSFHKLQRRNEYIKETDEGVLTFYGYLYKMFNS